MKKMLFVLLMLVGIGAAQAQISGNLGMTTDYRFRGMSQTLNATALQGGVDYAHSSGCYVGNWNSSVSSEIYTKGAGIENDVYAGFKKEVAKGLTVDVGTYNYLYPRVQMPANNSGIHEVYAAVGYGPVTVKYNRAISNYFGVNDSKGTQYLQADLSMPVPGVSKLSAVAHIGRTDVTNHSTLNYTDMNIGAVYNLSGWALGLRYYKNSSFGSLVKAANTVDGHSLWQNAMVVSVAKSF